MKTKFGFSPAQTFAVPQATYDAYAQVGKRGAALEAQWDSLLSSYAKSFPAEHAELTRRIAGRLPEGWEKSLPVYKTTDAAQASRKLSEIVLTALHPVLPDLISGSADLTGSNLVCFFFPSSWTLVSQILQTKVKGSIDFQPPNTGLGTYSGTYIRYGVREHGMGAIANGLHAYGGIVPLVSTFMVSIIVTSASHALIS